MAQKLVIAVDDDASVLCALRRLLQAHGYAVQAYSTVDDFLSKANQKAAACLILDIHLNGASGIEVRRRIAAVGSPLPVIFMTADDSEVLRDEANAAGCVAYLRKPVSATKLINAIRKCEKQSVRG